MIRTYDTRSAIEKYNDPDTYLLTLKETAKILGVAYSTVLDAWRKNGQIMDGLPVMKIGARVLKVKVADIKKIVGA